MIGDDNTDSGDDDIYDIDTYDDDGDSDDKSGDDILCSRKNLFDKKQSSYIITYILNK